LLGVFLFAGEYSAQSIAPQQKILFDSLIQDHNSGALALPIVPSFLADPDALAPDTECNARCKRLAGSLSDLLWVQATAKTLEAHASLRHFPKAASGGLDPAWEPLIKRLAQDGVAEYQTRPLFAALGPKSYTPAYMAAKIRELYGVSGVGISSAPVSPAAPEDYTRPLPDVTIGSCLDFMKRYAPELRDIHKKHGVPPEYIIGLLLVETGLGTDLGNHSAFRALACMANTGSVQSLSGHGNTRQARYARGRGIAGTLKEKSNWAYGELKALIAHGEKTGLDVTSIPGSIYGAIGICQFMPSNVAPLGIDGDKDGRVDMFSVVDAMYSVANYLEANGWRQAKNDSLRRAVFRSYNNDASYAAGVLASGKQIALALKGKLARNRNALAGIVIRPRAGGGGYMDPSLRGLRPVPKSARITLQGYIK
jgi:membrane-bound lytic murein transglycosylase B